MEIEAKLENIDRKIDSYNEKIDNISSLITTLIHTFQQNQLPNIKSDILNSIEEKFQDSASFPDVDEMKTLFAEIREDINENQSGLKIKITELEKVISKVNDAIDNLAEKSENSTNSDVKEQLANIDTELKSLCTELASLKNIQAQASDIPSTENYEIENLDKITTLINAQSLSISALQKNIETSIQGLEAKLQNFSTQKSVELPSTGEQSNLSSAEIIERFNDLNLAITSVLSAIKIIDKKYIELKNFQELIEKLTSDVVSPIMTASADIKAFLEQTSNNFTKINEFVKEYDYGAFVALQDKIDNVSTAIDNVNSNISNVSTAIDNVNSNIDKITDTVNIDVNRLFDLVDEFKTNSDLSNHTISDNMEKIENMLTEYNENLEELTKSATAEVVKDGVKTLNDEFYLELLTLFNSLSFDEEAEDLKDFMENVLASITIKTDENSEKLNKLMLQFKSLINKIEGIEKTQNSISDYLKPEDNDDLVYSFDDIQSDLAKMRLVLNDISKSVTSSELVEEISGKINETAAQIELVSRQLGNTAETEENVTDIRTKIEELNAQVYDISLRTNKLLLSNEDSNLELKNNLEIFKEVFDKANPEKLYELFYELTHYFNDINEKIAEVTAVTRASHSEAVTIKNALVYVGEWLDNATNVLEEIRANSSEILAKSKTPMSTPAPMPMAQPMPAPTINIATEVQTIIQSFNTVSTNLMNRIKIYEDTTTARLDSIEAKLDKLIEAQENTKAPSTRPVTTKLNSLDKKFEKLEETLATLSEKLMKE